MQTLVSTEAKNRIVMRVAALRGQQGPSNKGQVHSLKETSVRGTEWAGHSRQGPRLVGGSAKIQGLSVSQ